jgi:hypothetical protein
MSVHSIFVRPEPQEQLHAGRPYQLQGVATDGGSGIRKVEVSTDGGATWTEAALGKDLGKYSWRLWHAEWKPATKGSYRLKVRATNADGTGQQDAQWNRSGYQRDVIEQLDVMVV